MRRILTTGAAIVLLTACADRMPTEVELAPAAQASAMAVGAMHLDLTDPLEALDDVLDRIIPALSDERAARPLAAALGGLRTGLASADPSGAPALIGAMRDAIERYARTGQDEADLDAVRLAVDFLADTFTISE